MSTLYVSCIYHCTYLFSGVFVTGIQCSMLYCMCLVQYVVLYIYPVQYVVLYVSSAVCCIICIQDSMLSCMYPVVYIQDSMLCYMYSARYVVFYVPSTVCCVVYIHFSMLCCMYPVQHVVMHVSGTGCCVVCMQRGMVYCTYLAVYELQIRQVISLCVPSEYAYCVVCVLCRRCSECQCFLLSLSCDTCFPQRMYHMNYVKRMYLAPYSLMFIALWKTYVWTYDCMFPAMPMTCDEYVLYMSIFICFSVFHVSFFARISYSLCS